MKAISPSGLAFLHSELKTGFTLVRIAWSAKDADKCDRILLNAERPTKPCFTSCRR